MMPCAATAPLFPYTTLFRSDAVAKLARTVELAKGLGLRLKIFDAYRPPEAQWRLWEFLADPRFIADPRDRKSTRLNSSHPSISYAVFCLKKKTTKINHLCHH